MFKKIVTPLIAYPEIHQAIQNVTGASKLYGEISAPKLSSEQLSLPEQTPRSMRESFTRAVVPLSDVVFRERYMNSLKTVRFGKLLEDLDTFAVYLSYKHNNIIGDHPSKTKRAGFSNVTAAVDQILVQNSTIPTADLQLSGYVSWVGKSSMEVSMEIEQVQQGSLKKICSALFVMVAMDALKNRPTPVTPIKPLNDEENQIFQRGEKNHHRRIEASNLSLFRKPPDVKETVKIHELYLETMDPHRRSFKERVKPEKDVWMRDNTLKSLVVCQPENRNMYGRIFGGFLMRQAYELAWAGSYTFARTRPRAVGIDDFVFRRPVEIGSFIYLHHNIGYVERDMVQSRVTIEVTDVDDPTKRNLANIMHVTFRMPGRHNLPQIIPDSYGESMLYVDSRRRLLAMKEHLKLK